MHTRKLLLACTAAFGLAMCANGRVGAEVKLPGGVTVETVDFERHVMGLFGRMGCNSGSCHGSFQGKGGLRLSLFGYKPEMDYVNLTRDVLGRRINPIDPSQSLLLLKATGAVSHGGGRRFQQGSWQYQVIHDWVARGAVWNEGSGEVEKITITPPEQAFQKVGQKVQLQVRALFKDGTDLNITPFCDFRSNDDAIVEASDLGQLTALRPGSTAIIIKYRGHVIPVNILVPMELQAGFKYPKTPTNNFIDEVVFARLKKLNMVPSELSDDAEFLRRLTIDTIGRLPTPDEIRAFLKDKSKDKRARKIDQLLEHPDHASLWALKYCDITGNDTLSLENPNQLRAKKSQQWHDWFRKRFAENMPYDKMVYGVLCATSRAGRTPEQWVDRVKKMDAALVKGFDESYANEPALDLFWRRRQNVPIEQWGEKTAAAFMGIRVECAQCHKHPFDRWTQEEYRSYANIFSVVSFGTSPEAKKAIDQENRARRGSKKSKMRNQDPVVKEIFIATRARQLLRDPTTNQPLTPKALGGPEIEVKPGDDPREELFKWLVSKDNPFFAKSFVNRVWGHYLGKGIVDPVDDFSLANPASNSHLLSALARQFLKTDFDIRDIERVILNSRVYQLSSKTNETNRLDQRNYAHAYVRPMMAEVVVDVLNSAMGTTENFGKDAPTGIRAIEYGPSQAGNGSLAFAFRIFGRPPRTSACDCERAMDPALPQKLFMMTDRSVLAKFNARDGRLQKLLQSKKSDQDVLDELFLATVSRFPNQREKQAFEEYQKAVPDRRQAFFDTLWALINTREFILNH